MDQFKNYNKSCIISHIGDKECSFHGQIRVIENHRVLVEILDVQRDIYLYMKNKNNILLYLKADQEYITIKDFMIRKRESQLDKDLLNPLFKIEIEALNVCYGNSWCAEDLETFVFDGFSCDITEGIELLGLTPYEEVEVPVSLGDVININIRGRYKIIETKSGFSYAVFPDFSKQGIDLHFGTKHKIMYWSKEKMEIAEVKQKINDMLLFFETLSGELITTTQVNLLNESEKFDYIGNCNFPKNELNVFKKNTFDSRWFVGERLFKVSDFDTDLDDALEKFNILIRNKNLAFNAYKQILLDEDVGIATTNKFLKVMQVIEGIERNDVNTEEQEKFDTHKAEILKNIKSEEDRKFIEKYCTNNGDNFFKCLQKITKNAVKNLSGLSNKELGECHTYTLLQNIKNDRDAYTHASHILTPILSVDELSWVTCCYKTFFRIEILLELGLDVQTIRNRFSYDRFFVDCYDKLFNLKIKKEEVLQQQDFM